MPPFSSLHLLPWFRTSFFLTRIFAIGLRAPAPPLYNLATMLLPVTIVKNGSDYTHFPFKKSLKPTPHHYFQNKGQISKPAIRDSFISWPHSPLLICSLVPRCLPPFSAVPPQIGTWSPGYKVVSVNMPLYSLEPSPSIYRLHCWKWALSFFFPCKNSAFSKVAHSFKVQLKSSSSSMKLSRFLNPTYSLWGTLLTFYFYLSFDILHHALFMCVPMCLFP